MLTIGRILVPVDFSPGSRAALEYAVQLAERFGASIEVLHVFEPPPFVPEPMADVTLQEDGRRTTLAELVRSRAALEVESILDLLERRTTAPVSGRLETGEASDVITRCAEESGADVIVMGTHGRRGLSHLLLGSVAERVVRRAPCPVLTIRVPASAPKEGQARSAVHS